MDNDFNKVEKGDLFVFVSELEQKKIKPGLPFNFISYFFINVKISNVNVVLLPTDIRYTLNSFLFYFCSRRNHPDCEDFYKYRIQKGKFKIYL